MPDLASSDGTLGLGVARLEWPALQRPSHGPPPSNLLRFLRFAALAGALGLSACSGSDDDTTTPPSACTPGSADGCRTGQTCGAGGACLPADRRVRARYAVHAHAPRVARGPADHAPRAPLVYEHYTSQSYARRSGEDQTFQEWYRLYCCEL